MISLAKHKGKTTASIQPASRMENIDRSATILLDEKARNLRATGKKIISLSLGEPDFNTPEHIINAAKSAMDKGYTHYTSAPGIPELREAVAERYRDFNKIRIDASNVMITPTKLGIFNSILAMVGSGDQVIIPEPAWVTYRPCVNLAGGKPVPVELKEKDEFRLLPENLAEKITKKTGMIILNTPCNPTGGVYQKSDIQGIAELAADHDLLVLTDETYEKIIYEGSHHSIASEPDMFERTITVSGLSKTYAMTGWRVGWLVTHKDIFKQIKKLQEHSITCATSFAQHGAVAALTGSQKCVADMVSEFKSRRDLVVSELNKIDGISCRKPKGAFYVFFSYDFPEKSMDFAMFLLNEAGVALTPGSGFGAAGEGFLRMSYAASQSQLKQGIKRIKQAVEKHF